MSSMPSPSAEGRTIGKATKPWTIGRLLGSGACGSVHELDPPPSSSKSSMQYAVKLVHLPPSSATNKKRKKTAVERNADLLLHEYTILQNAGAASRGTVFPDIPLMGLGGGPPGYGETEDKKFRYLVMERMAAPLSDIVPILLSRISSSTNKTSNRKKGGAAAALQIPLGEISTALFNCIHALHQQNYLFQDVKPENFMLSYEKSSSSQSITATAKDVAQRIRLIDFGLVERYSDMASSSHREDAFPAGQLVGTPAYASLNVMGGHTPSRRDDFEALGYVICELILLLVKGSGGGSARKYKGGGTTKNNIINYDVLPWSHAKSDDELYQIKLQEMDHSKRSKSVLFTKLKAAGGVDVPMGKYFNEVINLEYAEKPDYDSLRGHLKNIVVVVTPSSSSCEGNVVASVTASVARGGTKKAAAAAAASPKKPPAAAAPTKKSSRLKNPPLRRKEKEQSSSDDSEVSSDENVENCKKQKISSRTIATQTDEGIMFIDDSSENEDEGGGRVQEMDWELADNDDKSAAAAPASADGAGAVNKNAFLKLEVISGSHKGQVVSFGGDYPDTVIVGRELSSSSAARALKDSVKLALTRDESVSSIHAKFVITSKKNLHSVRVTDMSSTNDETLVNGARLASGKSKQAFVGDKITVGGTNLQVKRAY